MDLITLPTTKVKSKVKNPKRFLLLGHTKIGKTHLATQLENSLLIDLEGSAVFYDAMKVDVLEISKKNNISLLEAFKLTIRSIKGSETKYDYIVVDNTSRLESIAAVHATDLYKKSTVGKNFEGTDVVSELERGAGYGWLRIAFEQFYGVIDTLPNKGVVYIGHIKKASIKKDGKDLTANDLDLTGKLKSIVVSDMDAIGTITRHKDGDKNVISFRTDPQDLATGSRCAHLRNKEFIISEMSEDGQLTSHWDKVFLPE